MAAPDGRNQSSGIGRAQPSDKSRVSKPPESKLLIPRTALVPGEPDRYSGRVHVGMVAGSPDRTLRLYQVVFFPGGRTAWHAHTGEQILLSLEGEFLLMIEGQGPRLVAEGHAVRIPPAARHWHGGFPTTEAAHLAVNVACTTTWLELVSEEEYRAAVTAVGR